MDWGDCPLVEYGRTLTRLRGLLGLYRRNSLHQRQKNILKGFFDRFLGGDQNGMFSLLFPERNPNLVFYISRASLKRLVMSGFLLDGSARGADVSAAFAQGTLSTHELASGIATALVGTQRIEAQLSCGEIWAWYV